MSSARPLSRSHCTRAANGPPRAGNEDDGVIDTLQGFDNACGIIGRAIAVSAHSA
jgi:hypothetical protein